MPEVLSTLSGVTRYSEREALGLYFAFLRKAGTPALAIVPMEECSRLLPCLAEPDFRLAYLRGRSGDENRRKKLLFKRRANVLQTILVCRPG